MKRFHILFGFFIALNSLSAQTYDFLNKTLIQDDEVKINLSDRFLKLHKYISNDFFNERNISEKWEPLPSNTTPEIKTFFENFDLSHVKYDLIKNKHDSIIDFNLLDHRFIKFTKGDIKSKKREIYQSISKPIFNCSKDWSIIIKSTYSTSSSIGSGGTLYIYRKKKSKWQLYHKFTIWFN